MDVIQISYVFIILEQNIVIPYHRIVIPNVGNQWNPYLPMVDWLKNHWRKKLVSIPSKIVGFLLLFLAKPEIKHAFKKYVKNVFLGCIATIAKLKHNMDGYVSYVGVGDVHR